MRLVLKRPRFLFDLAEELLWLNENAGQAIAERWYRALQETIQELQRHPYLGRPRSDLKPASLRTWRIGGFPRWLIIYQVREVDTALVLLRVRSRTMNLTAMAMDS